MSKKFIEMEQQEHQEVKAELEQVPTVEIDAPEPVANETAFTSTDARNDAQIQALQQEKEALSARGDDERVKHIDETLKKMRGASQRREDTSAVNPNVEKR